MNLNIPLTTQGFVLT